MGPAELNKRLRSRFDILGSRSPGIPDRHRTIEAVIEWSYELLDAGERSLFEDLGSFMGSFDLAAIEAVHEMAGGASARRLVDLVESLVSKNLLVRSLQGGQGRFRMLFAIRDFAASRLDSRPGASETRMRHARHFLARAEAGAIGLRGSDQKACLEALEADDANFDTAIRWLVETRQARQALSFCDALEWYWFRCGRYSEGSTLSSLALGMEESRELPRLRGRALRSHGWLAFTMGSLVDARARFLEAESILRPTGDRSALGKCLACLGVAERFLGDSGRGTARCLEGIALARESGELHAINYALIWAFATTAGRRIAEEQLEGLEEAIAIARETGDSWSEAHAFDGLGDYLREAGEHAEALACYEQALAIFESLGEDWMRAWTLEGLGMVALQMRKFGEAENCLKEGIGIFSRLGDRSATAYLVGELALVAAAAGNPELGDLLLGAFTALDHQFARTKTAAGFELRSCPPGSPLALAAEAAASRSSEHWLRGKRLPYEAIVAIACGSASAPG
jgi:predicted ATPase